MDSIGSVPRSADSAELYLHEDLPASALEAPLPDALARDVVDRLKREADRHWYDDPTKSLDLAERIVAIGARRGDARQTALGVLARGNAYKFLDRREEAWDVLDEAGRMYLSAGDEVGWARTRISRLDLSVKLNRVASALADSDVAGKILERHGDTEMLMRLLSQQSYVYNAIGEQQRALELLLASVPLAELLGEHGLVHLGPILSNVGYAYEMLGDLDEAQVYFERARELFARQGALLNDATAENNLASLDGFRGRYRSALRRYHELLARLEGRAPMSKILATKAEIVECYLQLNRHAEAGALARETAAGFEAIHDDFWLGCVYLQLATAEAGLGNPDPALAAISRAEDILIPLAADYWLAKARLWRARIALHQGAPASAERDAQVAADSFRQSGHLADQAAADLVVGESAFALSDLPGAESAARSVFAVSRRDHLPFLRYGAHLLLGRIAEAQDQYMHAARRYDAAAATVQRWQCKLSMTLRPDFLQDKGEALRALIGLQLRLGNATRAFEALERAKSQALFGYLAGREQLRWKESDDHSRALIQEFERLRGEHHWRYRRGHAPPAPERLPPPTADEVSRIAVLERRMRGIAEQLYLRSGNDETTIGGVPSAGGVQQALEPGTALVEYYTDGTGMWAFVLDRRTLRVQPLPLPLAELARLVSLFQSNVAAALAVAASSKAAVILTGLGNRILERLYGALFAPLRLPPTERVVVVPTGVLHYLPFHLLHHRNRYLIERSEVVVLPSAGLVTRAAPRCAREALAIANSWESRLPRTIEEARLVHDLYGGRLFVEGAARRGVLKGEPVQVLHIAAHGEHRLDQPDLSYVLLDDGPLFADDLMQQNMGYELVTLSACETGRARVAPNDELIGIGRGFLYAGAGALLVSLWRVTDDAALDFMRLWYGSLHRGATKASALRAAQTELRAGRPDLHPAHWGGFELIGDGGALSALGSTSGNAPAGVA